MEKRNEQQKELKKKARLSIKHNYWRAISVCFLIAMLTTAYPATTTFFGIHAVSGLPGEISGTPDLSNSDVVAQIIERTVPHKDIIRLLPRSIYEVGGLFIDICTSTSSLFFSVLRAVNGFLSEEPGAAAFLAAGVIVSFLGLVFVGNLLRIGENRFFMESRKYGRTRISKIFFLYKLRCIWNPAWVMLCRSVCQALWTFTIAGGIIKYYEYSMIPYILAENPKIGRKKAFYLSRQMMKGNKQKLFLIDLTFLGWKILSVFTLGLLDFFVVNPYIAGTRVEFYFSLRRNYVLSRCPGYENLNDSYLEHVPSEDELLISKALYDDSQGPYTKISYFEPEQYPVFLFHVQPPMRAVKSPLQADRKYDLLSYIFLFFAFSVFGWLAEAVLDLVRNGALSEHMLLAGPWTPLYGLCGVLMLLFVKRFQQKPVLVFVLNFLIYSGAAFCSSLLLEDAAGLPVRDYENYFLNLDGRIYMGGSVAFALLGCAFIYYLAPRWTDWFLKLTRGQRILLCVVLLALGVGDIIFVAFTELKAGDAVAVINRLLTR